MTRIALRRSFDMNVARTVLGAVGTLLIVGMTAATARAASPVVELVDQTARDLTAADQEYFLMTAKVVRSERLPGLEGAARVTLSNGRTMHDALVWTVEAHQYRWATIRDSYRYNVAAYRLDKMLGLGAVPATIERKMDGRMASVTWWTEGPNSSSVNADYAAFRELVWAPRNGTAGLPAEIAHANYTQAFGLCDEIPEEGIPAPVSLGFRSRLKALDHDELRSRLASLLSKQEIHFLWERRHEILEHTKHALAGVHAGDAEPAVN